MAPSAKSVDDYLASLPANEREVLEDLRQAIRSAAPQAEETIGYRIPLYRHHGHVVGFAAYKNHCSLFVTDSAVAERFAKDLEPYEVRHTTIHFPVDRPLPASLVRKIVRFRVAENEAKAARRTGSG